MPLVANTVPELAAAVNFAVAHGAKVINMSFAYPELTLPFSSDVLYQAIQNAASSGVVIVAAAGNDGAPSPYAATQGQDLAAISPTVAPAAFRLPNMINVAAIDSSGNLTYDSNYGATMVDLGAPGSSIYTTAFNGNGYYPSAGGTSFAAPFVTGVVALVESQHPEYTAAQVVQRVVSTTKPLASLGGKTITGGMVDAYNALLAGCPNPTASASPSTVTGTTTALSVNESYGGGDSGLTYTWSVTAMPSGATTPSFSANGSNAAENTTATFYQPGNYSFQVTISNGDGYTATSSVAVSVVAPSGAVTTTIDDTSAGFSESVTGSGSWVSWTGGGLDGLYATAWGSGSSSATATATWTFNVTPGVYEVWATWQQAPNRATNSPYSVYDGTTLLNTVPVNQQNEAKGYYSGGDSWNTLGERFQITGTTLRVTLTNQGVSPSLDVVADAIRINKTGPFYVDDSSASGFSDSGAWTTWPNGGFDGTNMTAQGAGTGQPATAAATWTFNNLAAGTYEVWTTWISAPNRATNAPYTISEGTTTLGTTLVNQSLSAAGYYAQGYPFFTLGEFKVTTSNEQTATDGSLTVTLSNQGVDTSNYVVADAVRINKVGPYYADDSDYTGFKETGGPWQQWFGEGFNLSHSTAPGAGAGLPATATATWTFANLVPGVYEVWATWQQATNRATNSPYSVYDGTTWLNTIPEDQTQLANDGKHFDYGTSWVSLGESFSITSGTLTVVLTNAGVAATEYVVADGIRINRLLDPSGGGGVIESFSVRGSSPTPISPVPIDVAPRPVTSADKPRVRLVKYFEPRRQKTVPQSVQPWGSGGPLSRSGYRESLAFPLLRAERSPRAPYRGLARGVKGKD